MIDPLFEKVVNSGPNMEDFEYKGHMCLFMPHPKLYGNYEIYQIEGEEEHILSRAKDKSDCIRIIDKSGSFYARTGKNYSLTNV